MVLEINKFDPATGTYLNDVTLGQYDVVVTEVPMQVTFENSQFEQAIKMREKGIAIPDPVVIRYSNLADKNEVIEQMRTMVDRARSRVLAGDSEAPAVDEMRRLAPILNRQLSELEGRFSAELGEASRTTQRLLLLLNASIALMLTVAGLAFVRHGAKAQAAAFHDCHTADGTRIEIFANLGGGAQEAAEAVRMGAEGCGLLRTEFLFMERATPPGAHVEGALLAAAAGKPAYVEKPMARHTPECDAMLAAFAQAKQKLFVAYYRRALPRFLKTKELLDARAIGCDTYVTGEGNHHTWFDAMEGGINLIYAGHWATETLGVKALAEKVSLEFGVPYEFFAQPTGL